MVLHELLSCTALAVINLVATAITIEISARDSLVCLILKSCSGSRCVLSLQHLHVVSVEALAEHHLILLILHLYLGLVIAELLKNLPLLLLSQVLTQKQLCLLPEELHLSHLIQLLHLMKLLKLQESLDLSM